MAHDAEGCGTSSLTIGHRRLSFPEIDALTGVSAWGWLRTLRQRRLQCRWITEPSLRWRSRVAGGAGVAFLHPAPQDFRIDAVMREADIRGGTFRVRLCHAGKLDPSGIRASKRFHIRTVSASDTLRAHCRRQS